jgi:hypothetical protein
VGASQRKEKPKGLDNPKQVEDDIRTALGERLTPPHEIKIDGLYSQGVQVLRIRVSKGTDRPYCLDGNKFYVRDEAETSLAVRDEIFALVREVLSERGRASRPGVPDGPPTANKQPTSPKDQAPRRDGKASHTSGNGHGKPPERESAVMATAPASEGATDHTFFLPQIGVEIVGATERNGNHFYSIRDLRNGHVIHNVTRKGARKLWNYAIQQYEDHPPAPEKVQWRGNIGLVGVETRAGKMRYDLARRDGERMRIFYGVTDEGMEGDWGAFVQEE